MQKYELIQMHTFLLQLKTYLEDILENHNGNEFLPYTIIEITPYQVYKSKTEHKIAVFTLCKCIADLLSNNKYADLEKISNKLNKISKRFIAEFEKSKNKR